MTKAQQYVIDQDRLASVTVLKAGSHNSFEDGACLLEAVAYVAGERFSDHPKCACPVLAAFLRRWNDDIKDDQVRTALLMPLVPRLVGSRSTKAVERRRADLALDWFIRVHSPVWIEMHEDGRPHADAMRALPPLLSREAFVNALPVLTAAKEQAAAWDAEWDAARDAAWDAEWDAARAAAWDAEWDAARAAAWDAAWAAARAAAWDAEWDAARAAAWDAAWAAARAAAWDAAWAAAWAAVEHMDVSGLDYHQAYDAVYQACAARFAPARDSLQRSALELVDRMLAVTPESLTNEKAGQS